MTRGMNTMPTARRGRSYFTPGAADKRGLGGICSVLFILALLIVPPILLLGSETARHSRYIALSDAMDSQIVDLNHIHDVNNVNLSPGTLVHGTTNEIDTIATDPQAGVSIPGALTLRRNTEYCQWSEHPSRQCQKCSRTVTASDGSRKRESYDCNCITTYNYVKTWRNHRINSFLFDQPGAHHNPQRDPLPSETFAGDATLTLSHDDARGGGVQVHLDTRMFSAGVRNQSPRHVDFVPNGRAPPPSFFSRWFGFLGQRNTRYESLQMLRDTQYAPAATRDNFVYVGQGGYFFSPYENPSTTQRLFNYFVQYMEGSLFDWQIGDLMPSCTAGDIRFSYQVQDPSTISFLGQLNPTRSSSVLEITPRSTLINQRTESIGFVHAGSHSAQDMIIAEDIDSRNMALVFRALLLIWAIPAARLLGVALGRELGDSSLSTQITASVGMFASTLGGAWLFVWGTDVGSRDTILVFIMGGYFGFLALRSAARSGGGRRWHAVWCRIGRWANVPPEWRVEDSYVGTPDRVDAKRL